MLRTISIFVGFLLAASFSFGQEVVVEAQQGDNLAKVANDFLGDPGLWQKIKVYRLTPPNDSLIYPGDWLILPEDLSDAELGTFDTESGLSFPITANPPVLEDYNEPPLVMDRHEALFLVATLCILMLCLGLLWNLPGLQKKNGYINYLEGRLEAALQAQQPTPETTITLNLHLAVQLLAENDDQAEDEKTNETTTTK